MGRGDIVRAADRLVAIVEEHKARLRLVDRGKAREPASATSTRIVRHALLTRRSTARGWVWVTTYSIGMARPAAMSESER